MENITQKTKSSQQEKSVEYVDLPKIYQKKPFANLNRRFLTIWAITLAFNVIIVTILAHKHFEITSEYVRKVQEHYANFLYDKIEQSMSKLEETGEGMAAKETKAKKSLISRIKALGKVEKVRANLAQVEAKLVLPLLVNAWLLIPVPLQKLPVR